MSYDVYLTIDTGGEEPAVVCDIGNYTSNVSRMWRVALGQSLADLHDRTCADCLGLLEAAVAHMRDPANAGTYRVMEPENGWGNHLGATRYLADLLAGCREHPKATIRISH